MAGIILHIDVNSAFLSWSAIRLLESGSTVDLREIPAIVGGDQKTRHGIVVAKSIPAKRYGIHTADTVASAFRKCPTLVSVPPDHTYYREKSEELMDLLRSICPRIQQVSVDECFMDYEPIKNKFSSPEACGRYICDTVFQQLKFTVNVGISDRKILAKMASDFEKPNKVHTLYATEIQEKLWPLPIGELHMCGKSSAATLRAMGIRTIGDLAQTDPDVISARMKSHGVMLWQYANGIDDREVITEPREVKSIGNSTTLTNDAVTREDALPVLKRLADSVSRRLKKHEFLAGQVTVEIKYATFRSVSHQAALSSPSDSEKVLYENACLLFDELWDGTPVRLLGVRATRLSGIGEPVQMNLFDYQRELDEKKKTEERHQKQEAKDRKKEKLAKAIASLEGKYGRGIVRSAGDKKQY